MVQERLTSGADGRSRTGMEVIRRILSAVRLPIPPHRQVYFNFPLHNPRLDVKYSHELSAHILQGFQALNRVIFNGPSA